MKNFNEVVAQVKRLVESNTSDNTTLVCLLLDKADVEEQAEEIYQAIHTEDERYEDRDLEFTLELLRYKSVYIETTPGRLEKRAGLARHRSIQHATFYFSAKHDKLGTHQRMRDAFEKPGTTVSKLSEPIKVDQPKIAKPKVVKQKVAKVVAQVKKQVTKVIKQVKSAPIEPLAPFEPTETLELPKPPTTTALIDTLNQSATIEPIVTLIDESELTTEQLEAVIAKSERAIADLNNLVEHLDAKITRITNYHIHNDFSMELIDKQTRLANIYMPKYSKLLMLRARHESYRSELQYRRQT